MKELTTLIAEYEKKIRELQAKQSWYQEIGDVKSYHFCRGMLSVLNDTVSELYVIKIAVRDTI